MDFLPSGRPPSSASENPLGRSFGLLCLLGALLGFATLAAAQSDSPAKKKRSTQSATAKTSGAAADEEESPAPRKKSTPSSTKKKTPAADSEETPAAATPRPKKKIVATEEETPAAAATPRPRKKAASADEEDAPAAASTPKPRAKSPAATETAPAAGTPAPSPAPSSDRKSNAAPNASVEPSQIAEYAAQPDSVRRFIDASLALTKLNLTYAYGSADPATGGMDCSGTIYYLLREAGFKDVPRDASGIYSWARKNGQFFAVVSRKADGFEFSDLLPGDLLFWNGTYSIDRDPPVTHVMIYLGTEKGRGKKIMVGASDGRSYDGKSRWGVSVFDFVMPRSQADGSASKSLFLGYARVPGLRTGAVMPVPAEADESESAKPEPAAEATEKPEPKKTGTPAKRRKKATH